MFIHLLSNYILKVTSVWSWNRNNSHCNTRKQGSAMSPFMLLYANFQRKHRKNISAPLIMWPLGMAWWLVFKGSFLLLCYAENVIKGTLGATMNLKITIAVVFFTMLLYFIPFKKNWYLKNCLADNGCCTASLQRRDHFVKRADEILLLGQTLHFSKEMISFSVPSNIPSGIKLTFYETLYFVSQSYSTNYSSLLD